ncbi:MetQ/NlpA family ABC transporter substrate-binding protein [Enterococcus columbae]|uniref:Lipoprotein n=1 Tax=Enterococcus columbae DSM 7374 = ATCC 51263 TaxID=1121865 RepID=S1N5H2_9ENTE|nr:MetQ/NlpA family ABC transporter substrate-binding protein [Enterococcus columbae]EOT44934.1 hypothetical protein OMW_00120 [Enterococcus columbae DSM 7374 = ATCC 51263]EOW84227.1 hypothetical protein I568_00714 [Enterococcus columbae DSM 7374 = ATCC 51263]OJG24978.1 hypothetical protein RR47_GL002072 [Enterococcus columbae DSM 7374 = ATCC 51263]
MKKSFKKITQIVTLGLVVVGLAACGAGKSDDAASKGADSKTITVGANPTPHAEILEQAKAALKKEGYTLKVKVFNDYIMPNTALEDKQLDANYFQTQPYLDKFNEEKGTHIVGVGNVHFEPLGIYPGKTKTLEALKDGATVAIPNDPSNEARALLLLEDAGLIQLKDGAGITATVKDVKENPKNLNIKEVEAAQTARSLQDVDIAVVNGNYAVEAKLDVNKDALHVESADSDAAKTYANMICVREGDENNKAVKALVKVLQSDEIKQFIDKKYNGAVVAVK